MKTIRDDKKSRHFIAMLLKSAYLFLGILVILFAVLVTIARLATPYVNKERPRIEAYLSAEIGKPVHIGKIDMWWDVFGPSVELKNLTINHQINIQSLNVDINLIESIYSRTLVIKDIVIMGGAYDITELPSHDWLVNGVAFSTGTNQKTNGLSDLFAFSDIVLSNIRLSYSDLEHRAFRVDIGYLHLNNIDQRHSLSGSVDFLEPYSLPFRFNLTTEGDISDFANLKAKLYVKVSDVLLSEVFPQGIVYGRHIHSGFAEGELWVDWNHEQVQGFQSQWDIMDLRVSKDTNTVFLPKFSGNLAWQREQTGWLLSADRMILNMNHHAWPTNSFYIQKQAKGFRLGLFYVYLDDLRKALPIFSSLTNRQLQQISALKPVGVLSNLSLQQEGQGWSLDHLGFSGNLNNVSVSQQHTVPSLPALTHVSGQVYWQKDHGRVFVNSHNLGLEDDKLFVSPVVFSQAYLDVNVARLTPDHWSIGVRNLYLQNQDMTGFAQGSMQVDLKGGGSSLDMLSSLQLDNLSNLDRYIPLRAMPAKAQEWFEHAFRGGSLLATTLFRGPLGDFPFQHPSGTLLSEMSSRQFKLVYDHAWPVLSAQTVSATIDNDTLTMTAPVASSRKITAKNVLATIPSMTEPDPHLILGLTSSDHLEDMVDFLGHSGMSDSLGDILEAYQPVGQGHLNLKLNIPLDDTDKTAVSGHLKIQNGRVTVLKVPSAINKINGDIDFTQSGLSVQRATALVFNTPATITASTFHTNFGLDVLTTHVQSVMSAASLQAISQLPVTRIATGTIPFDLFVIRVLNAKHDHDEITVQAKSDLKGLAVNLPGDLVKKASEERPLKLQFNYFDQHFSNIKMAYGDLASFDLDTIGAVGSDKVPEQGFSVNMTLKQFNWALWQAYFSKQQLVHSGYELSAQSHASLDRLSQQYHNKIVNINLQIGRVSIYNQELQDVAIVLQPQNNAWDFHVSSNNITGDFVWPLGHHPIVASFSHVYLKPLLLPKKSTATPFKFDITQIPPIKLTIDDFSYGQQLQGKLLLDLSVLPHGLDINNLQFVSKLLSLKLAGYWLQLPGKEVTSVDGDISSTNVSEFVKTLTLENDANINLSTAKIKLSLTWQGSPYEPVLKTMVGDLELNLGPGNIADIGKNAENKLNFGRLLNALSVQSLMQKLTMNFNDYKAGYDFTAMSGKFSLNKGDLYTPHTQFDGPVASVAFSGHANVVRRDFNLALSITPHVTGSVPVVAGLLINPAVGVAAWVANFLFSPAVSQAAAQHFQMTGSWDDPKIVSSPPNQSTQKVV